MENHKNRPEFIKAQSGIFAIEKRSSGTLFIKMLYVAKKSANGYVLRIAIPLEGLHNNIYKLIPAFLVGIIISIIFSSLISRTMSQKMIHSLSYVNDVLDSVNENIIPVIPPRGYEEIDSITDKINLLSKSITKQIYDLSYEKSKTKFIFDNIDEGIVLLDINTKILYINKAALRFLDADSSVIEKPFIYLTHQINLTKAVENSINKNMSSMFDIDSKNDDNLILSLKVTPAVFENSVVNGAIIMITDVSDIRKTEQIRKEFVANASHELKTPITSIKGFAELLLSGIVSEKNKTEDFLNRIINESDRMILLINDILNLSRIESENVKSKQEVNIRNITLSIVEDLKPQALEKNVLVIVSGEDCYFTINIEDLELILRNLIDNAIKYNIINGKVEITLISNPENVIIKVKDTGIGIPTKYQSRVFERFFRVNKGRSRKLGGTGLGLSIVKHTALRYNGEIFISSVENIGTTIEIKFKK